MNLSQTTVFHCEYILDSGIFIAVFCHLYLCIALSAHEGLIKHQYPYTNFISRACTKVLKCYNNFKIYKCINVIVWQCNKFYTANIHSISGRLYIYIQVG